MSFSAIYTAQHFKVSAYNIRRLEKVKFYNDNDDKYNDDNDDDSKGFEENFFGFQDLTILCFEFLSWAPKECTATCLQRLLAFWYRIH